MRVAFINHSAGVAGAQGCLLRIARCLQQHARIECLMLIHPGIQLEGLCERWALQYRTFPMALPWYLNALPTPEGFARHLADLVPITDWITATLRDEGIDAVFINTLTHLAGPLAAARLNLPYCLRIGGILDSASRLFPAKGMVPALDSIICHCAASIICPTHWIGRYYQQVHGTSYTVIGNPMDVPESPPAYGIGLTTFCNLSTLEPHKGVQTLLEASRLLRDRGCQFRVQLFADGPADRRKAADHFIREHDLQSIVILNRRTGDVGSVYRSSHALVSPSLIEGSGNTLWEAMAHARPLIVSDSSGHRELVEHGKWGFLCPPTDAGAFADRMQWIIENRQSAAMMGLAGYNHVKAHHDGAEAAASLAGIFEQMLADQAALTESQLRTRYTPLKPLMVLMDNQPRGGEASPHARPANPTPVAVKPAKAASPTIDLSRLPPLVPGLDLPRVFTARCKEPTISALSVMVGLHMRRPEGTLTCRITDATSKRLLASSELALEKLSDNMPATFHFEPLTDMADRRIRISLASSNKVMPVCIYDRDEPVGLVKLVAGKFRRLVTGRPVSIRQPFFHLHP